MAITATITRTYPCRAEELPVVAQFLVFTLNRDSTDFETYSPMFNRTYISAFEQKTAEAKTLAAPETETAILRAITTRLYERMDQLLIQVNRIKGYVALAGAALPISVDNFGFKTLQKALYDKDVEKILREAGLVAKNLETYNEAIVPVGFTAEQKTLFTETVAGINADNQTQFEIVSGRKQLVQDNIGVFNELYGLIKEICRVGKILYKSTNPAKSQDYTFRSLLRKIRRPGGTTPPPEGGDTPPAEPGTDEPNNE